VEKQRSGEKKKRRKETIDIRPSFDHKISGEAEIVSTSSQLRGQADQKANSRLSFFTGKSLHIERSFLCHFYTHYGIIEFKCFLRSKAEFSSICTSYPYKEKK
jgi:hypothetical protein